MPYMEASLVPSPMGINVEQIFDDADDRGLQTLFFYKEAPCKVPYLVGRCEGDKKACRGQQERFQQGNLVFKDVVEEQFEPDRTQQQLERD